MAEKLETHLQAITVRRTPDVAVCDVDLWGRGRGVSLQRARTLPRDTPASIALASLRSRVSRQRYDGGFLPV